MRAAASRTFCTAGSNNASSTPTIAITTSSSISVNAPRGRALARIGTNRAGGIVSCPPFLASPRTTCLSLGGDLLAGGPRPSLVVRDHLAVVAAGQKAQHVRVDGVHQRPHTAIAEDERANPRVITAETVTHRTLRRLVVR